MTIESPDTWTWNIKNFENASFENYSDEFFIICNEGKYYFCYEPEASIKHTANYGAIHLFLEKVTDLSVLWSVCLINNQGEECYSSEIHTRFMVGKHQPVIGGVYNIDRTFILNSANGLLSDGNLTVKCNVTVIEDAKVSKLRNQIVNTSSLKMHQDYQSLLESSKFSDVVFVVGGQDFKLHKNILSTRSPVFAAMFESDLKETKLNRVEIIDVDVQVFEVMLKYIYSGNVESIDQCALDLLVASDKYQLEPLKLLCSQSLMNNLTIESAAEILTIADMHAVVDLKAKCIDFITQNATKVLATDGWMQMAKTRVELMTELYKDIAMKYENK